MIKFNFEIDKKKFDRRALSEVQHKLRPALKCYTVKQFTLDEEGIFSFITTRRMYPSNKVIEGKNKQYAIFKKEDSDTDSNKYKVCLIISSNREELINEK